MSDVKSIRAELFAAVLVLCGAGLATAYWWERLHAIQATNEATVAKLREDLATAQATGLQSALDKTEARAEAQGKVNDEADKNLAQIRRAAATAEQRAIGLRNQVNALAARCGAGAEAATAAAPGEAASSPGDLLAELYRRADARAGELAAIADERGERGQACERTYQVNRDDTE